MNLDEPVHLILCDHTKIDSISQRRRRLSRPTELPTISDLGIESFKFRLTNNKMSEAKIDAPAVADRSGVKLIPALIVLSSLILAVPAIAVFFSRQLFVCEIINNFRLQLSVLILISSFLLCCVGFRRGGWVQALLGAIVFFPIASSLFPASQPNPGPKKISLLSFNVLGDNTDRQPILDLFNEKVVDVLVVVEYENAWIEPLEQLNEIYPYAVREPRWHGFGIAVYSRHPIVKSTVRSITKNKTDNPFIVAEIQVEGQSFVVCAGHFLAPISPSRLKIRNSQLAEVSNIIRNVQESRKLPVILVGDFNCVAWSSFAVELMRGLGLRDSRQGYFYHGSWPTDNPLVCIPIDNAFVSQEFHIHDRQILPALTSDHFPLLLEFSLSDDH